MDPFNLSSISGVGAGGGLTNLSGLSNMSSLTGLSSTELQGLLSGTASARSLSQLSQLPGMPPMSMDGLMTSNQQQEQITKEMLKVLFELMKKNGSDGAGATGGAGGGGYDAGGYGGGGYAGGAAGSGQPGDIINTGASVTDPGPIVPGTDGLLEHANRMVGLQENRDTAAIQAVTGESGINPATTPWCAAWAMNMLEDHGVMDLDGLSNRNYCPTIKSWSQGKGTWGENGRYTPKPGDAILFDWEGDGTSDHIGIVEKIENGRVYTIEGNSSDSVKKNSYALGDRRIDGYVQSKGKGQQAQAQQAPQAASTQQSRQSHNALAASRES